MFPDIELQSGHADLQENCLAISNLNDGLDVYGVLNMQLIKTYSHGNINDMIFKVAFIANGQLVSGEKGGYTQVYGFQSGQLLQMLDHCKGELRYLFCILFILHYFCFSLHQMIVFCRL